MGFFAASGDPAIVVAYIMAGAAILGAILTFFVNRRTGANTYQLGIIEAAQEGMKDSLEITRADLALARSDLAEAHDEIRKLRAEVKGLRDELAVSLRQHEECETVRRDQGVQLERLRAELQGET